MKNKIFYTFVISICVLVASAAMAPQVAAYPAPATAMVYVYPQTITVTAGENYTVEIRVKDVVDLYVWSIGMTWDPAALEGLNFTEGPFLKTGGNTILVEGTINNTAGEIYGPYGCTLLYPALVGVNGSGVLAYVTFMAKATGTFNVHPAEVELWDSQNLEIPTEVVDVFTTVWYEIPYNVVTVNNLTNLWGRYRVSHYAFNKPAKEISFNVTATGPVNIIGFCNVTIPKTLLFTPEGNWTALIDGESINYELVENATHSSLYFTYALVEPLPGVKISRRVQIGGTWLSMPPVAEAGADQTVCEHTVVSFNAAGSSDDVAIVRYKWDFADGTIGTGVTINHTYTEPGTYEVTLTVEDAWGNSGTDTVTITVEIDAVPPVAEAGADQTVMVGETVTFNAAGSSDNVAIANYTWDFKDGNVTTVTNPTITHIYTEPGTYEVTLTVRDARGNSGTDTVTITVEAPPAFPWWIVGVVVAVVVVVAAVVVVVLRRKPGS